MSIFSHDFQIGIRSRIVVSDGFVIKPLKYLPQIFFVHFPLLKTKCTTTPETLEMRFNILFGVVKVVGLRHLACGRSLERGANKPDGVACFIGPEA